jgi:hypothetical protein
MDATINITFGVLMAVLGLVGIYQAALLTVNHTRRCTLARFWPISSTVLSHADYCVIVFNADRANVADMEMSAGTNANTAEERQQEREQQES